MGMAALSRFAARKYPLSILMPKRPHNVMIAITKIVAIFRFMMTLYQTYENV